MCPFFGVCVNVNSTDATTDATALLLPAQNTHTFCVRECVSAVFAHCSFLRGIQGAFHMSDGSRFTSQAIRSPLICTIGSAQSRKPGIHTQIHKETGAGDQKAPSRASRRFQTVWRSRSPWYGPCEPALGSSYVSPTGPSHSRPRPASSIQAPRARAWVRPVCSSRVRPSAAPSSQSAPSWAPPPCAAAPRAARTSAA